MDNYSINTPPAIILLMQAYLNHFKGGNNREIKRDQWGGCTIIYYNSKWKSYSKFIPMELQVGTVLSKYCKCSTILAEQCTGTDKIEALLTEYSPFPFISLPLPLPPSPSPSPSPPLPSLSPPPSPSPSPSPSSSSPSPSPPLFLSLSSPLSLLSIYVSLFPDSQNHRVHCYQTAILSVGTIQTTPGSEVGMVEVGVPWSGVLKEGVASSITATLSLDARVLDYELSCCWLGEFKRTVEQPSELTTPEKRL